MRNYLKVACISIAYLLVFAGTALAETENAATGLLPLGAPIGAGLVLGLAGLGVGLGQGRAVASGLESISRNPGASGNLQTPFFVGLVFMEAIAILSFVIAFKLLGLIS